MRRLISLGFSCQSRFAIEKVSADHRRFPFDFNITSKDALLSALRDDGAALRMTDPSALSTYRAPDGREGVTANGIWFWHDFPLTDDQTLDPDWPAAVPDIAAKYEAMWRRFRREAATPEPKTFVVSNTQGNLEHFTDGTADFVDKFRVTQPYLRELDAALRDFGARNFDILHLTRFSADASALNAVLGSEARCVFGGRQSVPVHDLFSVAALSASPGRAVRDVEGDYEGGWRIEARSPNYAEILRNETICGSLLPLADGYIAAFEGAQDEIHTAVIDDGALYWSTKRVWRQP